MEATSARWQSVSEPVHEAERVGLAHVRHHLPDAPPYLAWSNLTFSAVDGSLPEVDLLVLAPAGLFLVELKGWRRVRGNGQRWQRPDAAGEIVNPLVSANLKAKRLRSMLEQSADRLLPGLRIPWVQAAVFLHHPELVVELDELARAGVYGMEPGYGQPGGLKPLVSDLLTQPPARPDKRVDERHAERLADLMVRIGFTAPHPSAAARPPAERPHKPQATPHRPAAARRPRPSRAGQTAESAARRSAPPTRRSAAVPAVVTGAGADWPLAPWAESFASLLAFSPDGRLLATASPSVKRGWEINILQTETATRLAELDCQDHPPNVMVFAPDGSVLASGSNDGKLLIWQSADWRRAAELDSPSQDIRALAFSPDSRLLLSGGLPDSSVRVWDTRTCAATADFDNDDSSPLAIAFHPDGQFVAIGSTGISPNLSVWCVDGYGWTRAARLDGHDPWVRAVAFSPDGTLLASGDDSGTVRLWDATTWKPRATFTGHSGYVKALFFHPDGHLLASASDDRTVRVWQPSTGQIAMLEHRNAVDSLAFSPDGALLATTDNYVHLFRVPDLSATRYAKPRSPLHQTPDNSAWSPDASGEEAFDFSPRSPLSPVLPVVAASAATRWLPIAPVRRSGSLVAFSPDGRYVITAGAGADGWQITALQTDTGAQVATLNCRNHAPHAVAFAPDGGLLASGSGDGTVLVWATEDWRRVGAWHARSEDVRALAFSPDGRILLSGGLQSTLVHVWDTRTWNHLVGVDNYDFSALAMAFHPNGEFLAVGGTGIRTNLYVWRVRDWTRAARLDGHDSWVRAVAFSPDGTLLASGDSHGTVRLWDTALWRHRTALKGHTDYINALSFHPGGQLLASGSDDQTVQIWHSTTARHATTLERESEVKSLAFSPHGTLLATADNGMHLLQANELQ